MRITPDLTIGEVVKKYPTTIEVLENEGIHCVGCHTPYDKPLAKAFLEKNLTMGQIKELLDRMNSRIIENDENKDLMLTDKAIGKIKEFVEEGNVDGNMGLRISAAPGGCSGYVYDMHFDEQKENDKIIEEKGVKLLIENDMFEKFIKNSVIDFVETLQESGFKISNPNATHTCSCGQSFEV